MDQAAVQAIVNATVQAATQQLQAQINQQAVDLLQAQNDLAILQAAAAAPQPQAQVGPPAATVFAYTPGTWGPGNRLIDYSTVAGAKIQ
jgi:hypothetical protein